MYKEIVETVRANGARVPSRYGSTLESLNGAFWWEAKVRWLREKMNHKLAYMELAQVLAGTFNLDLIKQVAPRADHSLFTPEMAYGPRIGNQMHDIIRVLKVDPYSRQAILFIGKPWDGPTSAQPCTTTIQFLNRGGVLHGVVSMRSWDLLKGLPYDMVVFGGLVQVTARCVNAEAGHVFLHAGSAHLYLDDIDRGMVPNGLRRTYDVNTPRTWNEVQMLAESNLDPARWIEGKPGYIVERLWSPE